MVQVSINSKKQLIDTGVKFDTTDNWIFDGEYITKNKKDENISLFMIFDVYYCGTGKQPYELPWYSKKRRNLGQILFVNLGKMFILQNGKKL